MENLRHLNFAPSVQMHHVPNDMYSSDEEEDNEDRKDRRISQKMSDKRRIPENELSDSEDEGDHRRDQRSYRSLLAHDKERQEPVQQNVDSMLMDVEADDEAD